MSIMRFNSLEIYGHGGWRADGELRTKRASSEDKNSVWMFFRKRRDHPMLRIWKAWALLSLSLPLYARSLSLLLYFRGPTEKRCELRDLPCRFLILSEISADMKYLHLYKNPIEINDAIRAILIMIMKNWCGRVGPIRSPIRSSSSGRLQTNAIEKRVTMTRDFHDRSGNNGTTSALTWRTDCCSWGG